MKIDKPKFEELYGQLKQVEHEFQAWKRHQLAGLAATITIEAIDKSVLDADSMVPLVMYLRDKLNAHGFNFGLGEAKDLASVILKRNY